MKKSYFNKSLILLAIIVAGLILSQCKKESVGSGNLSIFLTDLPASYEGVYVEFEEVNIHYTEKDSTEGTWHSLAVEPGKINLLELQNGIDTLLFSGDIPAGTISQIRLVLLSSEVIRKTDPDALADTVPLDVPSGNTSGLKFLVNERITPDQDLSLTFDFDASQSIVEKGNGDLSLKPVIKISKIDYTPANE